MSKEATGKRVKKKAKEPAKKKAEEGPENDLAARLEEAEAAIKEKEEKVLRIAAEMDNFKKRLAREKDEFCKFANESFARELLQVADGLDNALDHSGTENEEALADGVKMTRELLLDVMARFGVERFSSKDQPFDPERHEALNQMEVEDEEQDGLCVTEYQPGYMMKDRLLRPAMVAVGRLPKKPDNPGTEDRGSAGTKIKVRIKDS